MVFFLVCISVCVLKIATDPSLEKWDLLGSAGPVADPRFALRSLVSGEVYPKIKL